MQCLGQLWISRDQLCPGGGGPCAKPKGLSLHTASSGMGVGHQRLWLEVEVPPASCPSSCSWGFSLPTSPLVGVRLPRTRSSWGVGLCLGRGSLPTDREGGRSWALLRKGAGVWAEAALLLQEEMSGETVVSTALPAAATRTTSFKGGSPSSKYVKLNVGGGLYYTTMQTLTKQDTMLKAMFSGRMEVLTDSEGEGAAPPPAAAQTRGSSLWG